MKSLKVVLFDWDGTLADTKKACVGALNEVLEEYGLPLWEEMKKRRDKNLSFMDNFPNFFGGRAWEAYAKYRQVYMDKFCSKVVLFEGAKELLELLKFKGIKIGLMTNKDRILWECERPSFCVFDKVVCGHEAARDKPYAEHALYTLNALVEDINQDTVWVVGDSSQDVDCANAVNARPIFVGGVYEKVESFASLAEFYQALRGDWA